MLNGKKLKVRLLLTYLPETLLKVFKNFRIIEKESEDSNKCE
jgi:hypothetical protein